MSAERGGMGAIACLLGPTASGKTAAALAFAARHPVEIISVDSALVYRGMDIGTAKPTRDERAVAPHHLIDIIDPVSAYSAAEFCSDALRLVDEIRSRGNTPLLVGGTMLYFVALTRGLNDLPQANAEVRASIDADAAREGWASVHARLARVDPVTAARLAPNDSQRIQRALEVFLLTGKAMSVMLDAPKVRGSEARFVPVALEPSDRSVLHQRIETRFDVMLQDGFVSEVESLKARGDLNSAMPSMRCVGYRQVWDYLDGNVDYATMRDKGVFASRQLCKRQLTWLRGIEGKVSVECTQPGAIGRIIDAIDAVIRQ